MFRQWFDKLSSTYTYLIGDPQTGLAVLIDPVDGQAARDTQLISEMGLTLAWVLDTHIHADHVTAAAVLRERTGCKVAYPASTQVQGADRLLADQEELTVGELVLTTRLTPGHTAGSACYVQHATRRVFTGDTLMIRGCGRTDFQGGSASDLYTSVHSKLFTLDDDYMVYPGHDYKGRTASTIGEEKAHNPRLGRGNTLAQFEAIMAGLNLSQPKLIDVAVPANRRLGQVDPWAALKRRGAGALQASTDWVRSHHGLVRLVDVREPDEYDGPLGRVPNTQLVPLGTLQTAAADWDRDQPLVLICRSGTRSDKGALALQAMGFRQVASMTGGTMGYYNKTDDESNDGPSSCG